MRGAPGGIWRPWGIGAPGGMFGGCIPGCWTYGNFWNGTCADWGTSGDFAVCGGTWYCGTAWGGMYAIGKGPCGPGGDCWYGIMTGTPYCCGMGGACCAGDAVGITRGLVPFITGEAALSWRWWLGGNPWGTPWGAWGRAAPGSGPGCGGGALAGETNC